MPNTRSRGTTGTTPGSTLVGPLTGPKTRRGRQRMSAARTGGTGTGATIDHIMTQWQDAGLIVPAEIAQARKYVGLALITLGSNR